MEFERKKRIATHLNIAPLIDIVFLLLLFFMLTSYFIAHPGIKINLPRASSARSYPEAKITIFIGEDNSLYLNGESLSLDDLPRRLKVEIEKKREKTVIIKADEKIDLGLAVRIMDIARQAEAKGLIISTKFKENVE